jgi:hypothetical protein
MGGKGGNMVEAADEKLFTGLLNGVKTKEAKAILREAWKEPDRVSDFIEIRYQYFMRLGRGAKKRPGTPGHSPHADALVEFYGGTPMPPSVFKDEYIRFTIKQIDDLTKSIKTLTTTYRPYLTHELLTIPCDSPSLGDRSIKPALEKFGEVKRALEWEARQTERPRDWQMQFTPQQALFQGVYRAVRWVEGAPAVEGVPTDADEMALLVHEIAKAVHSLVAGEPESGKDRWGEKTKLWLVNIIKASNDAPR